MDNIQRCQFLEDLPPELRLRIYEHLFGEDYHSSLLIRSGSKIEPISLAKAHAALLKTCRIIYTEAAHVLYGRTTFRVQIYPVDGFSSHGNVTRLSSSAPFLSRIQKLEIKCCIMFHTHIEPAIRLLRTFANALEEADADIKTLYVRSQLFPGMPGRLLRLEEGVKLGSGKQTLFQRMLELADTDATLEKVSMQRM